MVFFFLIAMWLLFMAREIIFVLDVISYADADEVGLDVVSGERKCGKQVVGEIVARSYFLVKEEGFVGTGGVLSYANIEHETDSVEHHFV